MDSWEIPHAAVAAQIANSTAHCPSVPQRELPGYVRWVVKRRRVWISTLSVGAIAHVQNFWSGGCAAAPTINHTKGPDQQVTSRLALPAPRKS